MAASINNYLKIANLEIMKTLFTMIKNFMTHSGPKQKIL